MKKLLWCFALLLFLLPSCSKHSSGNSVTVVKPRIHHRFYDRPKDKHKPRIKKVKMKK